MKKSLLKNYLKLGIFLFGISFMICSCQKEDIQSETSQEKSANRISFSDFNANVNHNRQYQDLKRHLDISKSSNQNLQYRINGDDNITVLTDEILLIQKNNISYYTFKIMATSEYNEFYNLVIHVDDQQQIIKSEIYEYVPNENWMQDTTQPYSGLIRVLDNDIISLDDLFSARASRQCLTGASGEWECNLGNNHAPGEGQSCTSWEFIINLEYGRCPNQGFGPEEYLNYSFQDPSSTNNGGGGGGGSTNNNGNVLGETPTTVLTPDRDEDDDCDTSKEDLKKVFPSMSDTDASTLASVINDKGKDFGIDTKEKLQHFLSQAGHEVGGFNNGFGVEESTNYTTKARLLKIFGKYYSETDTINKRKPDTYVSNPSGHANYVYCCRMGNGNESSGDGYKYRGRGIFQLTGKTNYTNFKTWYNNKYDPDKDFVTSPELLKNNDTIAILSALWYYKTNVLDKITVDSTTTVKKVTKKVNGGTNGLSDRKEIFTKAKDSIDCI